MFLFLTKIRAQQKQTKKHNKTMVNEDKSNDKFTWENVFGSKKGKICGEKSKKQLRFSMNNLLVLFIQKKKEQRW